MQEEKQQSVASRNLCGRKLSGRGAAGSPGQGQTTVGKRGVTHKEGVRHLSEGSSPPGWVRDKTCPAEERGRDEEGEGRPVFGDV